jgi:hypothetical protein
MPRVTSKGADDDQSILIHCGSGRIDGHWRERSIGGIGGDISASRHTFRLGGLLPKELCLLHHRIA